jgi:subtilisin family serine protease
MIQEEKMSIKALLYGFLLISILIVTALTIAGNGPAEYKPEELVCRMVPGYSIEIINGTYGTTVRNHQPETDCYLLTTQVGQDAESLAVIINARQEVEYCGANYYLDAPEPFQRSSAFLDQECIGTFPDQEAATTLNLTEVQTISTGADVSVAVIDGGINLLHPEFALKSGGVFSGWDYVDGDSVAFDEPGGPGSGHGTFVAGIIKLTAPESQIYAYRVLDTLGRGNGYDIASAILRAVADGCRVINLSLGMLGRHDAVEDALRYAEDQNVVVVAAAGNDSTGECTLFPYPGVKNYCLTVAALDTLNQKADFSNYGEKIDVCAPGTQIYSPFTDTLYAWWDGTSFAAPFVAGMAALLISERPEATWDEIHGLISETCINIDSINPGLEGQLGNGLIDMVAALQATATFVRGDANGVDGIDVADVVYLVNYIFKDGPPPYPLIAGDANCDHEINVGDAVFIVQYVFNSGPAPCMEK